MPQFAQTTQIHPGYPSDMLVGGDNYVVDRAIDQNQTIAQGDILVRDTTTGNWRINDGWTADNPHTDTLGIAMEAITTSAGQVVAVPVLARGQIKTANVNGLPAGFGQGSQLGLIILE